MIRPNSEQFDSFVKANPPRRARMSFFRHSGPHISELPIEVTRAIKPGHSQASRATRPKPKRTRSKPAVGPPRESPADLKGVRLREPSRGTVPVIKGTFRGTISDVSTDGEQWIVVQAEGALIGGDRMLVDPKGVNLKMYQKSPRVLCGERPVARCVWIKISNGRLVAKIVFGKDSFAVDLFKAYAERRKSDWAVELRVVDSSAPTAEELRSTPGLDTWDGLVCRQTELCSFSVAAEEV